MLGFLNRWLHRIEVVLALVLGWAVTTLAYSNTGHVTVSFWHLRLGDVALGYVLVGPVVAGAVLGYAYHHVVGIAAGLRHRGEVHRLQQEVKELRRSLDGVLDMPADSPSAASSRVEPSTAAEPVLVQASLGVDGGSVEGQPGPPAPAAAGEAPLSLEVKPAPRRGPVRSAAGRVGGTQPTRP